MMALNNQIPRKQIKIYNFWGLAILKLLKNEWRLQLHFGLVMLILVSAPWLNSFNQVSHFGLNSGIYSVKLLFISREKNLNFLQGDDFNTEKG